MRTGKRGEDLRIRRTEPDGTVYCPGCGSRQRRGRDTGRVIHDGIDMGKKNIGQRSCIGCGRKAHKSELLRFVADPEGGLLLDPEQRAPGRGGYFCRKQACFDRATKKRRLSVRFRRDVRMDPHSLMKSVHEQLGGGSSGWPK